MTNVQNTLQKDFKSVSEQVKLDLLTQILLSVKQGVATKADAKFFAQSVLAVAPFSTMRDLLTKLQNLGKLYKEARIVFLKYAEPYYRLQEDQLRETMLAYVHQGNIDGALALRNGGIIHG